MEILIIGAGAAGLMAAGAAARLGHRVTVLEHSPEPGKKLLITGKGRCNLTNNCTEREFLQNVRTNPRFLYSALTAFPPAAAMELFEAELGLPLKTERGRRVFPVSDRAADVRAALLRYAGGAQLVMQGAEALLLENGRCTGAKTTAGRRLLADAVLVATGGVSYPGTGSTGDGYRFARAAGHTIVEPVPSLVSLIEAGDTCKQLMGLSLRNVRMTLLEDETPVYAEQGELLFTHFGLSGPLTLSASAHIGRMDRHRYTASIDLKPALEEPKLYQRITRDFAEYGAKNAENALTGLLPPKLRPVIARRWGVPPGMQASQATKQQKQQLARLLKHLEIPIRSRGDLDHAVITSGGVDVREVDPKTMASRLCRGLYFAGEVLDLDGYTGGYNLQIAWCTAQAFAAHLG